MGADFDWKKDNDPTHLKRSLLQSYDQKHWIEIAANSDDVIMLATLMSNPNFEYPKDILFIALDQSHENFVLKLLTQPHKFDLTQKNAKGETLFQLAQMKNLPHVMARLIECESEQIKENAPRSYSLINNILKVLYHYLENEKKELNPNQEKSILMILVALQELQQLGMNDNHCSIAKQTILKSVNDIETGYSSQYKEKINPMFNSAVTFFYKNVWKSALAKGLKEALDKSEDVIISQKPTSP